MAKGMLKKAFVVGVKLLVIGILVAIPVYLLNALLLIPFGAVAVASENWLWVRAGSVVLALPFLLLHVIAYGWLVLKWKNWVFS